MEITRIRDEGQILQTPKGKLLGIVDTRAEFDAIVQSLGESGFDKIEAVCGEEGVQLLERIHTFFFSDMEDRVLKRHIDELNQGHIIIAITTAADRVDEAVSVASQKGARPVVWFISDPWQSRGLRSKRPA
jgi:hypothetical protein